MDIYSQLILPDKIETQSMYFLPKLGKNPLKLRRIVSATRGPTNTTFFADKLGTCGPLLHSRQI